MPPRFECPRCGSKSSAPDDVANRYCGRCHAFAVDMLCFRLFVDGRLASERWVLSGTEAEQAAEAQARIAADCDRAGMCWMVEAYNPTLPPGEAYMRFGTDASGMIDPHEVNRWPWEPR